MCGFKTYNILCVNVSRSFLIVEPILKLWHILSQTMFFPTIFKEFRILYGAGILEVPLVGPSLREHLAFDRRLTLHREWGSR